MKELTERFVADMNRAGIKVFEYHGRNFYVGPAVKVRILSDAQAMTDVPCHWDNLGYDVVVYPKRI